MDYKDEKESDKKKFTRKDFKEDVKEAVVEAQKGKKKGGKKTKTQNGYGSWTVAELRKKLNEKKKALLTKSGFPDGKVPRSRVDMVSLCKKLKRKRW